VLVFFFKERDSMKRSTYFLLLGLAVSGLVVGAQESSRGPDGGTTSHVSGVELLAIPGKPFSAKTSTEWTRKLEDGSTVTLRLEASLARDSQGRMYRERRSFVPANSTEKSRLNEVHLYDPTTRTQALCEARTFRCVITDYAPQTVYTPTPAGALGNGTGYLTRESLGVDSIAGMNVTGTRETRTINPGAAGNERAMVSTREFWYSPEIQTNLLVIRNDPQNGKQVIRLSDISLSEPDPHMFEIPIGYTARDERASAHRGR
jgi:hypothetical protein